MEVLDFPISIAPLMDYSDRHFRVLMRLLSKKTILYTEMISTGAILKGNRAQHLEFSEVEKPLVLQVGGDDVPALADCTNIAADYGYDEINLNTGCPSERVQKGCFGAALMAKPALVGEIVHAMCACNSIPVSVKCRIGIDGTKIGMPVIAEYEDLYNFAKTVFDAGAARLTVHARIAVLGGLSPKENREIPPLQYPMVYRLAKDFANHRVEINGGVSTHEALHAHLLETQGVMLGRVAIDNPLFFAGIDNFWEKTLEVNNPRDNLQGASSFEAYADAHAHADAYADDSKISRTKICLRYAQYLEDIAPHAYTKNALRHLFSMFNGRPGARKWRQAISNMLQAPRPAVEAVNYALAFSDVS